MTAPLLDPLQHADPREALQGLRVGCVARSDPLRGGPFRAELLEGLAAVGEALLGLPDPVPELPFGGRL